MESLKIDITKLKTFKHYSEKVGLSRQRIYQLADEGAIKFITIDGVKFVKQ